MSINIQQKIRVKKLYHQANQTTSKHRRGIYGLKITTLAIFPNLGKVVVKEQPPWPLKRDRAAACFKDRNMSCSISDRAMIKWASLWFFRRKKREKKRKKGLLLCRWIPNPDGCPLSLSKKRWDSFKSHGGMILADSQGLKGLTGILWARVGVRGCYQSQWRRWSEGRDITVRLNRQVFKHEC